MTVRILEGDCRELLRSLPDESVHCVVTSPPYFGLRDYGADGQIGLELNPETYVAALVDVFREVRRALRSDGTLWLNIGDSYAGSWGAQGHRISESDEPSWHSSQIKNHPKRSSNTGTIGSAGVKPKDLYGIPWMLAFALRADGWYLRQDLIWSKPNPMPESVTDRCTKAHEYLFLLSKSNLYHYDAEAIRETAVADHIGSMDDGAQRLPNGSNANVGRNFRQPNSPQSIKSPKGQGFTRRAGIGAKGNAKTFRGGGAYTQGRSFHNDAKVERDSHGNAPNTTVSRNKRSVWTVATAPYSEAHFATFPPALIEPCILAGCPKGGTVLDPFGGAGTTGLVADRLRRNAILIELNPEYAEMAQRRIERDAGMFAEIAAE